MRLNPTANYSLPSVRSDPRVQNDPQLEQIVVNVRDELSYYGIERFGPRSWTHPRRQHIPGQLQDFTHWADKLHADYVKSRLPPVGDSSRSAQKEYVRIRKHNLEKWGHPDAINLMRGLSDGLDLNIRVIVDQAGEMREFYPRPFDKSRETIEITYVPVDNTPVSSIYSQGELKSVEGKLKSLGLRERLVEYSNESVFEAFSCALQGASIYRFASSAPFLVRGCKIPTDRKSFRQTVYEFAVDQQLAHKFGPFFAPCAVDRWETKHDDRLLRVMAEGFGVNVVLIGESFDVNPNRVRASRHDLRTVYLVERFDKYGNPHYNAAKPEDGFIDRRCDKEGCIYTELVNGKSSKAATEG